MGELYVRSRSEIARALFVTLSGWYPSDRELCVLFGDGWQSVTTTNSVRGSVIKTNAAVDLILWGNVDIDALREYLTTFGCEWPTEIDAILAELLLRGDHHEL